MDVLLLLTFLTAFIAIGGPTHEIDNCRPTPENNSVTVKCDIKQSVKK